MKEKIQNRIVVLNIKYINFENEIKSGKMEVLDVVCESVRSIFAELFAKKFPIHEISPISKYNFDDFTSMEKNNTSCFNYRLKINRLDEISIHSYGTAIDINPIQNPYFEINDSNIEVFPKKSEKYINRNENRLGKIKRRGLVEEIVPIFRKNGFYIWGGDWDTPIDYHHFQLTKNSSELLVNINLEKGEKYFNNLINFFNLKHNNFECLIEERLNKNNMDWNEIPHMDDKRFNELIKFDDE